LLDVNQERSEEGIAACTVCLKLQVGDRWLSLEDALDEKHFLENDELPKLQHEVCRSCFEAMYEAIAGTKRTV
jgi:hypothetical protein